MAVQELHQLWLQMADRPEWQLLFSALHLSSLAESRMESDSKMQSQNTTKKKKKQAEEVKSSARACTPERPSKAAKKAHKPDDEGPLATPEKMELPTGVSHCRPADFGRPKKRDSTMLMQAGSLQLDPEAAADQACELAEDLPDTGEEASRKKKKHQRAFKSKPQSDEELKVRATSLYLSSIGLTWPRFQKFHTRQGFPGFCCLTVKDPFISFHFIEMIWEAHISSTMRFNLQGSTRIIYIYIDI